MPEQQLLPMNVAIYSTLSLNHHMQVFCACGWWELTLWMGKFTAHIQVGLLSACQIKSVVLGGMTKNVYHGIFQRFHGIWPYFIFFHASSGVHSIFYWLREELLASAHLLQGKGSTLPPCLSKREV